MQLWHRMEHLLLCKSCGRRYTPTTISLRGVVDLWWWWSADGSSWLGLGVVEEGGRAEHGGDDGEEAEHDHQRQPGHRQIQHQLRAVEHHPQRHHPLLPSRLPTPRLVVCGARFSGKLVPISREQRERERGREKGGGSPSSHHPFFQF